MKAHWRDCALLGCKGAVAVVIADAISLSVCNLVVDVVVGFINSSLSVLLQDACQADSSSGNTGYLQYLQCDSMGRPDKHQPQMPVQVVGRADWMFKFRTLLGSDLRQRQAEMILSPPFAEWRFIVCTGLTNANYRLRPMPCSSTVPEPVIRRSQAL